MTAQSASETALQAMIALQAGITNIHLYPPTSAIVAQSVEKLQAVLKPILQQEDAFTIAESGGEVLLQGHPLPEAESKKPQVAAFLQALRRLGIASISIESGVGDEDLLRFLEIAGKSPKDLEQSGGLPALMAEKPLSHIRLNERVFVEMGSEDLQQLASKSKMDELTRQLMGDASGEKTMQELAANPKLISRVLQLGLERMEEKKTVTSDRLMAHSFGRMIRNVDTVAEGPLREEVAEKGVQAMAALDPEVFVTVTSRNIDELMNSNMFAPLLQHIDDDKFVSLAGRLQAAVDRKVSGKSSSSSFDSASLAQAVAAIAGSERGRSLQQEIRSAAKEEQARRNEMAMRLKSGLTGLLMGDRKKLVDEVVMRTLPETITQLYAKGKARTAEQILDRIYEGLALDGPEIQNGCGALVEATVELLEADDRLESVVDICHRLLEWSANQEQSSAVFDRINQLLLRSTLSLAAKGKSSEVMPVVDTFLAIADGRIPKPEEIQRAAQGMATDLLSIQTKAQDEKKNDEIPPHCRADTEPASTADPDGELQGIRDEVGRMVADAQTEGAVQKLYSEIVRYAESGNFCHAEALREVLLETDPMALTEIVKTGEIIEDAKSDAIDSGFRTTWSALFDALSPEEINRFYHDLETETVEADRTLFRQGRYNDRLFFVEEGQLKLVYRRKDKDVLLQNLGKGDLAGVDTFFSLSVCTTSLIAMTEARVKTLTKQKLALWREDYPGLEGTLRDFCRRRPSIAERLRKKGLDRRAHPRVPISGTIECRILAASGEPTGKPFKGDLADLSVGGLSLYIHTAKEATVRLLLGRSIQGSFRSPAAGGSGTVGIRGTIFGVHYHLQNDYSLHVKFHKPLEENVVRQAARTAAPS